MKNSLWILSIKIQNMLSREEGQDLIEYALLVALVSFAAVGTLKTLASDINTAFLNIGTTLASA